MTAETRTVLAMSKCASITLASAQTLCWVLQKRRRKAAF
jgi:hypothetical protein